MSMPGGGGEMVKFPDLRDGHTLFDFYGNPILGSAGGSVFSVLEFGADPTGTFESTAAFNEALAALPKITVTNNGHLRTIPYGTITGGGVFIVNQNIALNHWGPWVTFDGLGFTFLWDYNANANGFCVDLANPFGYPGTIGGGVPPPQVGPQPQYWMGGIKNTIIDGTNATAGGNGGITGCSGEYCRIDHCILQNYTGGAGVLLESTGGAWDESWNIDMVSNNNLQAVVYNGITTGPNAGHLNSQSQGRLWLRLQCYPGQSALVVQNGAWLYHADITMVGGMSEGVIPVGGSRGNAITVQGPNSLMQSCRLNIAIEQDTITSVGAIAPRTIEIDTANSCLVDNCHGQLSFFSFNSFPWVPTQPSVAGGLNSFFQFYGFVEGDIHLSNAGNPAFLTGNATGG